MFKRSTGGVVAHHAYYLNLAFHQEELVQKARGALGDLEYDVLVGTGMSGALVVPVLAYALHKRFAVVRKAKTQTHSSWLVEGMLREGDRCLFVDDVKSSGDTERRVVHAMSNLGHSLKVKIVARYLYASDVDFQSPLYMYVIESPLAHPPETS